MAEYGSLVFNNGPLSGTGFRITQTPVRIGRASQNEVTIKDPSVSRLHAIIEMTPEGLLIRDQASHNGIKVDEVRVQELLFVRETVFNMGKIEIKFVPGSALPEPAAADVPAAVAASNAIQPAGDGTHGPVIRDGQSTEHPSSVDVKFTSTRLFRWIILLVVFFVLGSVMVIISKMLTPPPRPHKIQLVLNIGEKKLVDLRRYRNAEQIKKLGNIPSIHKYTHFRMEQDSISIDESYRDKFQAVLVEGKYPGNTTVEFYLKEQLIGVMSVYVVKSYEATTETPYMSSTEMEEKAAEFIKQAEIMAEEGYIYKAYLAYKKAADVFRGQPAKPAIFRKALEQARKLNKEINSRCTRLQKEALLEWKSGDNKIKALAVEKLRQITRLVSDKQDLRHQKAEIFINRMKQAMDAR